MSSSIRSSVASWTAIVPVIAIVVLAAAWGRELSGVRVGLVTALLAGAVLLRSITRSRGTSSR